MWIHVDSCMKYVQMYMYVIPSLLSIIFVQFFSSKFTPNGN